MPRACGSAALLSQLLSSVVLPNPAWAVTSVSGRWTPSFNRATSRDRAMSCARGGGALIFVLSRRVWAGMEGSGRNVVAVYATVYEPTKAPGSAAASEDAARNTWVVRIMRARPHPARILHKIRSQARFRYLGGSG